LFNVYSGLTTLETEDKLELESWMTNDIYFTESNFAFAKESENSLAVEDWMLNTKHFEVKKAVINSNEDVTYASNQLPF